MSIVTQTKSSYKPFDANSEVFSGGRVDSSPNDYRISGVLRGVLFEQIMSGSNELALATLSSIDEIRFVPGIGPNSIPLNEFAAFYGVSEKYLNSLLVRRKLIRNAYPNDISRVYPSDIRSAKAPLEWDRPIGQSDSGDLFKYCVNGSCGQMTVSLPRRNAFSLYSLRLVLATTLFMVYTDKSDEDVNIKKTLIALKRSPYRFMERRVEEPVKEPEKSKPSSGIPVTSDGSLVLSPEIFTSMIKTAVKEAVSEVMSAIQDNQAEKDILPDNDRDDESTSNLMPH